MIGSEAASFYESRQREAMELIGAYESLNAHVQARLNGVAQDIGVARFELARAYLPALSDEAIARAADLTGFLGFERRDPRKAMHHERHVLESAVSRVEADERYRDRELLAGPDGTLTSKLVEVEDMLAPWAAECNKYEVHDGFLDLIRAGYDTPEFEGKWWQSSYWKQWAAGDRICKALGVDDFGDDIVPVYTRAAGQRDFWLREKQALLDQITEVHELVRTRDQAVARIPRLPALYLQQSQSYLAEYLEQADAGLLEKWLSEKSADDRPTIMALRKLAGLKAKHGYLYELQQHGLHTAIEQLRQRAWKFANKSQKYLRSKHYWRTIPDREIDHKFVHKLPKYRERPTKLRKLVDRMYAYDDYARFDLSNDPALWWFEMTGKKPPRQWATTRRWYDRRPTFHIARDDFDDDVAPAPAVSQSVAVATAARELDEVGYLS